MISRGIVFVSCIMIFFSCQYEKGPVPPQLSNKSLFEYVEKTAGSGYYQNGNVLNPAGNSPHGSFKLRMNSIAQSILDSLGEPRLGLVFKDSSLIVKEIESGAPIKYAVMFKNKGSWAWAEFNASGEPYYSISARGEACISCHSVSPQRDLTRTFDLH
jgi:hypothetical protein